MSDIIFWIYGILIVILNFTICFYLKQYKNNISFKNENGNEEIYLLFYNFILIIYVLVCISVYVGEF